LSLERHFQQTEVKTFGSAAFWTTTQLLTVSSQIKNPISAVGRLLDVSMEIYAITVITTLAGAIGSFLQATAKRSTPSADGAPQGSPSDRPTMILAFSALRAATAAAAVAEPAGQQQDEENDDDDCEHVTSQRVRVGGLGCEGGLFAAAAGERVDDLVALVLDGRSGLVALALVL
jgi:hypothetical protein